MNKIYLSTMAGLLGLIIGFKAEAQTGSQRDASEVIVTGQKNESKWFRVESQHFIVYSDTSTDTVTQLLTSLERLDYVLRIYTQTENKSEKETKITYYYSSNSNPLKTMSGTPPAYAIGLYTSCASGVQGFGVHLRNPQETKDDLAKLHSQNESLSYLFEGYARHFLYRQTDLRSPNWFIDGFANYFASTRFSDNQVILGKAPSSIQDYINFISGGHRYSLDYKDILEDNDSKGHNYANVAGLRLEFEAKSWILTHYILSSSDNLKHFRQYESLVSQNISTEKAFEQAFGFKLSKLSYKLWQYRHQSQKSILFNISSWPNVELSFSTLPKSATDFVLLNAALNTCPDKNTGAQILETVTSYAHNFPQAEYAQLSLSRAQIDWGKPQDAINYLSTLTQRDTTNYEAFYLLGLAQVRTAEQLQSTEKQNILSDARRNLLRAISLNQNSAEATFAFYKLGVIESDQPREENLGAAALAWQRAHEVDDYARATSLVYEYLGRKQEAKNITAILANNTRNIKMASWAKNWQIKLSNGVSQAEILQEMRAPASATTLKEWTIANEYVMQAVKTQASTEDAQNVILQEQDNQRNDLTKGGSSAAGQPKN